MPSELTMTPMKRDGNGQQQNEAKTWFTQQLLATEAISRVAIGKKSEKKQPLARPKSKEAAVQKSESSEVEKESQWRRSSELLTWWELLCPMFIRKTAPKRPTPCQMPHFPPRFSNSPLFTNTILAKKPQYVYALKTTFNIYVQCEANALHSASFFGTQLQIVFSSCENLLAFLALNISLTNTSFVAVNLCRCY